MIRDFWSIKVDDELVCDCDTIREALAKIEALLESDNPAHEITITKWGGRA